jgi:hypothetical protein
MSEMGVLRHLGWFFLKTLDFELAVPFTLLKAFRHRNRELPVLLRRSPSLPRWHATM